MATFDATIGAEVDLYLALRERVIESHPASTPIEADLIRSSEGQSPEIASVTALSSTSIRITFARAAVDNAALSATNNYEIDPALTVHSITPEDVTNPTYVDLVVDEQKQGEAYTVTLRRIVAA